MKKKLLILVGIVTCGLWGRSVYNKWTDRKALSWQ